MNDLGISFAGLSRIYQSLHKKTEGTLQFPITTKDGMTDLKIILTSKEVRIITEIEAEGLPRELNLSLAAKQAKHPSINYQCGDMNNTLIKTKKGLGNHLEPHYCAFMVNE